MKGLSGILLTIFCFITVNLVYGELKKDIPVTTKEKKAELKKTEAKKGDKVKVLYEGTLNDGSVFDKSKEDKPLEFKVGGGNMIKGFDKAVIGMKLNEEKTVKIKPVDAYGEVDLKAFTKVLMSSAPPGFKPEKGKAVTLRNQDNMPMRAVISDFNDKEITFNFNHPMAGKELTFKIKLVGIE